MDLLIVDILYQSNNITIDRLIENINNQQIHKDEEYDLIKDRSYTKLVTYASSEVFIKNTNTSYLPSLLVVFQGPSHEITAGSLVRYELNAGSLYTLWTKESAIYFGGFYRFRDAVIIASYIDYDRLSLGLSYDINVSSLKTVSTGRGGFEISLRYITPFVSKHYGRPSF